jgi:hypothetical protein
VSAASTARVRRHRGRAVVTRNLARVQHAQRSLGARRWSVVPAGTVSRPSDQLITRTTATHIRGDPCCASGRSLHYSAPDFLPPPPNLNDGLPIAVNVRNKRFPIMPTVVNMSFNMDTNAGSVNRRSTNRNTANSNTFPRARITQGLDFKLGIRCTPQWYRDMAAGAVTKDLDGAGWKSLPASHRSLQPLSPALSPEYQGEGARGTTHAFNAPRLHPRTSAAAWGRGARGDCLAWPPRSASTS